MLVGCVFIIQQKEKIQSVVNSTQNIGKREEKMNSLKDHFTVFSWGLACTGSIIIPFGKLWRITYKARKGLSYAKETPTCIIKRENKTNKANHVLKIASPSKQREITLALLLRSMPDPPILFKWNNKRTKCHG